MLIDNSQVLRNLGTVLSYFFPLWPLVVLAGLGWRRRALAGMMFGWILMGGVWVLTLFGTTQLPSLLMPEPLNTVVFFAVGAVLMLLLVVQPLLRQGRV